MAEPFDSGFELDQYEINSPSMLMCSNNQDLANWLTALHTFKIIDKKSLLFLTETANLANNDMQAPLGTCILKNGEITNHTHHGSMGNYECLIQRFKQDNTSIIVLINRKNGNVFDISEVLMDNLKTKK